MATILAIPKPCLMLYIDDIVIDLLHKATYDLKIIEHNSLHT